MTHTFRIFSHIFRSMAMPFSVFPFMWACFCTWIENVHSFFNFSFQRVAPIGNGKINKWVLPLSDCTLTSLHWWRKKIESIHRIGYDLRCGRYRIRRLNYNYTYECWMSNTRATLIHFVPLSLRIVTFCIEISGFQSQPYYYTIFKIRSLGGRRCRIPVKCGKSFFFVPVAIAQFSPLTYQINGLLYIRYNLIASIGFDLLTCLFERIYCTLFFLRRSECNLIFSNEKKNHHSQSSKPIPCKMQLVWWTVPHNRAYDAVDSQSQCASNIHNLHRDREINCEQQAREKKEIEFPKSITHSSHSTVNNSVPWTTCYG